MEKRLLAEQLKGLKTSEERANLRASICLSAVINNAQAKGYFSFKDKKGRSIVIEQAGKGVMIPTGISPRSDKGAEPVWFKVSVDGKYLNGDGWYGFVNPPMRVPDGTFREVYDEFAERTVLVPNTKEDVLEATKVIILQAVGGE